MSAAFFLAGCGPQELTVTKPLDTSLLAPAPVRETLVFNIRFTRYNTLESDIIAKAWAAAKPPSAEIDDLWRKNGLAIASADKTAAREVTANLRRAGTFRIASRQTVMRGRRPFDITIGRKSRSSGLIYTTRSGKTFRDVVDLRFFLKVVVLASTPDSRVSLAACFAEGADERRDTSLEGLQVAFSFAEGMMLLVGPREDPPEMSLGEVFYKDGEAGREALLVIVEPKLSR